MTPEQLKAALLQAAIQGKLVPQNPADGDAADLLAAIRAERARRHAQAVAAAKAAKRRPPAPPKPPLPIPPDAIPFPIPPSWQWVRLGEIGQWRSGTTPSRTNPDYYGGMIPWVKTGDLNDDTLEETSEYVTKLALDETSLVLHQPQTVLMAMYGATIGKLSILTIPATTNQACCACNAENGINNRFLFYYLLAMRQTFIRLGAGGAQPNISKEKICRTPFPLPPLAEQERIVAKLETALTLCDAYAKDYLALQTLDAYFPAAMRQALLQAAIRGELSEQRPEDGDAADLLATIRAERDRRHAQAVAAAKAAKRRPPAPPKPPLPIPPDAIPFPIPSSWQWVRLGEIVQLYIGKTPPRAEPQWWGMDYPWVSIADMSENEHIVQTRESVSKTALKQVFSNKIVPPGTLLMSFKLTIGRISILDIPAVHNEAIVSIIPYSTNLSQRYLFFVLPYMTRFGESKQAIKGKTLNGESLRSLPIPVPPLAEQERIVAKLEACLAQL